MIIKFSKRAIKFLDKLSEKDQEKIRSKIKFLVTSIDEEGIIPFRKIDIKKLDGDWKGFMRLRIGKIRIIFKINREKDEMYIYEIDFRGDVYK